MSLFEQFLEDVDLPELSDFSKYRAYLSKRFGDEDDKFCVFTKYLRATKRYKFTFNDNGKPVYDYVDSKDFKEVVIEKLFILNQKKIDELKKKGETNILLKNHFYLSSWYFLQVLSAYMIIKNEDEEDKQSFVDKFELNLTNLFKDEVFLNLCEKFNKDKKDNYYDLLT